MLRIILPLLLLPGVALSQGSAPAANPAAQNRQEFPRPVVVYVAGGISDDGKAAIGAALLNSLVGTGACVGHENAAAFLATADDWSRRGIIIDDSRICEIGRYFGIKYVCAASVSPAFGAPGAFTVFARMLNTETERAKLTGEATSPLRTAEDLALAANTVAEKMLGRRVVPAPQAPPEPTIVAAPTPPATFETSESNTAETGNRKGAAAHAPTETAAPAKQTVAVYMAGEDPDAAEGVHGIIGGELARVLSESDKYIAVDRTQAILEQIDREHVYQRSGAVGDDQIKAIGHQLGVQYLCISNINPVGKRYYLDTRLVDVVTAEIMRSVTATSTLKNAGEMARVGRNIALELLEAEKTMKERALKKAIFRGTAIGLDVLGAAAFAYGYIENNNVVKQIKNDNGPEADRVATRRNVAYIAGGVLIAAGVVVHIVF